MDTNDDPIMDPNDYFNKAFEEPKVHKYTFSPDGALDFVNADYPSVLMEWKESKKRPGRGKVKFAVNLASLSQELLQKIVNKLDPEDRVSSVRRLSPKFNYICYSVFCTELKALESIIYGQLEDSKDDLTTIRLHVTLLKPIMFYVSNFSFLQILQAEYKLISNIYLERDTFIANSVITYQLIDNLNEFNSLLRDSADNKYDWHTVTVNDTLERIRLLNQKVIEMFFMRCWKVRQDRLGLILMQILICALNSSYRVTVSHEHKPKRIDAKCHISGQFYVTDSTFTKCTPDFFKVNNFNKFKFLRLFMLFVCNVIRVENFKSSLKIRWGCLDLASQYQGYLGPEKKRYRKVIRKIPRERVEDEMLEATDVGFGEYGYDGEFAGEWDVDRDRRMRQHRLRKRLKKNTDGSVQDGINQNSKMLLDDEQDRIDLNEIKGEGIGNEWMMAGEGMVKGEGYPWERRLASDEELVMEEIRNVYDWFPTNFPESDPQPPILKSQKFFTLSNGVRKARRVWEKEGENFSTNPDWLGMRFDIQVWCPILNAPLEFFKSKVLESIYALDDNDYDATINDVNEPQYEFKMDFRHYVKARSNIQDGTGYVENIVTVKESSFDIKVSKGKELVV